MLRLKGPLVACLLALVLVFASCSVNAGASPVPQFSGKPYSIFSGPISLFSKRPAKTVAAFDPKSIADLVLWLDAADTSPTNIVQSSGAVSQWNDKSTAGRNATQATGANQPGTGTRTINGRNTLNWDGSNDFMTFTDLPNAAGTIFMVIEGDTPAASNNSTLLGGSNIFFPLGQNGSTNTEITRGGWDIGSAASSWRRNGTLVSPTNRGTAFSAYVTGQSAIHLIPLTQISGINSLGYSSIGPFVFDGKMAEVLVYARTLSTAEINTIGAYLSTKWSISWTNL